MPVRSRDAATHDSKCFVSVSIAPLSGHTPSPRPAPERSGIERVFY